MINDTPYFEKIYGELLAKLKDKTATKADHKLLEQIHVELARRDFKYFCHLMRPHYKWQWFHKYVMERLQAKVLPITDYDYEYSRLLLRVGDQHGKGLQHGTPVKTLTGWKNIEKIQVGDIIDSGLGTGTQVIGVYPQGLKECYKITFIDDRSVNCDEDHLWEIHCTEFTSPKKRIQVLNTKELVRLHSMKTYNKNLCVPYYEPNITPCVDLLIPPYLLGVLLGNGSLSEKKLAISTPDEFIVNKCNNLLSLNGDILSQYTNIDYGIKKIIRDNSSSYIKRSIIQLGLINTYSHTKFIPSEYLHGSYDQRIELIKGLMDTDGTIGKQSSIQYSTASKQLALDMQYLIRSIGGLCKIKEIEPYYTYKGEKKKGLLSYQLSIRHRDQTLLFSLPRKLERCQAVHRRSNAKMAIWDIQPIGRFESTCIKVDNERGLFTTKDFIVTHNTTLSNILFNAWCLGRFPNKQILALTYSDERAKQPTRDLINVLIDPTYKKIFPEFKLIDELTDIERQAEKSGQKLTNRFITNANSPKPGKQGMYLASSLGGSYLGNSGDIINCDDLFAGQKEANSATIRDNKWELFSSSVLSRQQKDTVIILTGTWWNRDDIIGRVQTLYIDNEKHLEPGTAKWELIEFNSQKDHRDYSYDKRKEGDYLWPEERMKAYLDQKQTNPRMWTIKHQNLPPDLNGVLFKPSSFRYYDSLPTDPSNMKIIISIDTSLKAKKTSDPYAISVYGIWNMCSYLLRYINQQMTLPECIQKVKELIVKLYPNYYAILVELASNGEAFQQLSIENGLSRVQGFDPQGKGDKWARANEVLPIYDAGQVFVPSEKLDPTVNFYVNQHLSFTGEDGRRDDLVDTSVQHLMHFDYLFRGIPLSMPKTIPRQEILSGNLQRLQNYRLPMKRPGFR